MLKNFKSDFYNYKQTCSRALSGKPPLKKRINADAREGLTPSMMRPFGYSCKQTQIFVCNCQNQPPCKSFKTACAVLCPDAANTPPGCVAAPVRQRFLIGVLYADISGSSRKRNIRLKSIAHYVIVTKLYFRFASAFSRFNFFCNIFRFFCNISLKKIIYK